MVKIQQVGAYLTKYIAEYNRQYNIFTSPVQPGLGYPRIHVSPYLNSKGLTCLLATDGAIVLDENGPKGWRTSGTVTKFLVSNSADDPYSHGKIRHLTENMQFKSEAGPLKVARSRLSITELFRILTYNLPVLTRGDGSLRANFSRPNSGYWEPLIIRDIAFTSNATKADRFIRYGEFLFDVDDAAWDERSAWARAMHDIRRDFAHYFVTSHRTDDPSNVAKGGKITLGGPTLVRDHAAQDRLVALEKAADGLQALLAQHPHGNEGIFHDYIRNHPKLLDVYGIAVSKPKFTPPPAKLFLGKHYVEPDFVIIYGNQEYKLIELERPDHEIPTTMGHPRVAATHPVYQISEWRHFISRHYNCIEFNFPGIASDCPGVVIMSRDILSTPEFASREDYLNLLRREYPNTEFWTYDDVIKRARMAVFQISQIISMEA